jgi:hypothetical protein
MRAVVWLAGCLGLFALAQHMHLWQTMADLALATFIYLWVFAGALWVSKGVGPRRASWRASEADVEDLRAAAEKAAHQAAHGHGGPIP